jgi:hypothetical protein
MCERVLGRAGGGGRNFSAEEVDRSLGRVFRQLIRCPVLSGWGVIVSPGSRRTWATLAPPSADMAAPRFHRGLAMPPRVPSMPTQSRGHGTRHPPTRHCSQSSGTRMGCNREPGFTKNLGHPGSRTCYEPRGLPPQPPLGKGGVRGRCPQSRTFRCISSLMARTSGAYMAEPAVGRAWNVPGVSARIL